MTANSTIKTNRARGAATTPDPLKLCEPTRGAAWYEKYLHHVTEQAIVVPDGYDRAEFLDTFRPDGSLELANASFDGVPIEAVWSRDDEIVIDMFGVDAHCVPVDRCVTIAELLCIGALIFGEQFVGVRLVATDAPANTRLARADFVDEFVSWSVAPLPAWLAVRP